MQLIKDKAQLKAAIKSISTRGAKLDNDIWIAATSAMAHDDKHGDVTIINELVAAMPKGSRVNALNAFITAHGKVTYNEEDKCFEHDKTGNFDLEGAQAKSWVEYKPETPYRPIDALALIKAMAIKVQDADVKRGDKVTKAQAKSILQFAASMGVELDVKA